MKPTTYKKLLKDLQKLQKKLVTAYADAVRADHALTAWVTERWHAAEVGGHLDTFIDVVARRSSVQLLLRTVYVRVLEDLAVLEPARIRGQWGLAAFKEVAPALGVRGYLRWVFRDLAKDFPALFTPGPDELPMPGEDLVREIWDLWHREDGKGRLVYDWQSAEGQPAELDSRFLGDLYQDLDKEVRKRFALLQTPVFVEEYILDHTLTPALEEFDPVALRERGETFRLIDPTCGSGHFLIGAFHRLADWWQEQHGLGDWEATTRALESVWGADLNPHAVDIARFRLLLEVRARTGESRLEKLASLPLNLAVMDTLIPWERLRERPELFPERDRLAKYATAQERVVNAAFMDHDYHVVVGNPPYVSVRDPQKRDDYRVFWKSCYMEYVLSVPFFERFMTLGFGECAVGFITSASFSIRGYGKKLLSEFLPVCELDMVVECKNVRIPGHDTSTIIVFGRGGSPERNYVDVIAAKRGDDDNDLPLEHRGAWQSLVELTSGNRRHSTPYSERARVAKESLFVWPWRLIPERYKHCLDAITSSDTLADTYRVQIGTGINTGENEAFLTALGSWPAIPKGARQPVLSGDDIRDWDSQESHYIPWPDEMHSTGTGSTVSDLAIRRLWSLRTTLDHRKLFSVSCRERGIPFYRVREYYAGKYEGMAHVVFPLVATHGHFRVLGPDSREIHSAIIMASAQLSEQHAHELCGTMNTSVLGFWMRMTLTPKGGDRQADGTRAVSEEWSDRIEFEATKLHQAPTAVPRYVDWA